MNGTTATRIVVATAVALVAFVFVPTPDRERRTGAAFADGAKGVRAIVDTHCVKCHGGGRTSAGLDLTVGLSALVDRPSAQADGLALVVAGQPERSYLMLKLDGAHGDVGEGARMPLGRTLEDAERDAVREWIAAGAR